MRELTFTKAIEVYAAINNDEAIATNEAVAKATGRIRRQHDKFRATVLAKVPPELRDLVVKRARGCNHEGIGLPGCKTCDPRTTSEGGPQPDPISDDVPAMPSHELDERLAALPPATLAMSGALPTTPVVAGDDLSVAAGTLPKGCAPFVESEISKAARKR